MEGLGNWNPDLNIVCGNFFSLSPGINVSTKCVKYLMVVLTLIPIIH